MFFLSLSNTNLEFDAKKFIYRSYITTEVLSTAKKFELINKYKFIKTVLNGNSNTFVI